MSRCSSSARSRAPAAPVMIFEAGVHLKRIGRHRHRVLAAVAQRAARAIATPVFPTPVGPKIAITAGRGM